MSLMSFSYHIPTRKPIDLFGVRRQSEAATALWVISNLGIQPQSRVSLKISLAPHFSAVTGWERNPRTVLTVYLEKPLKR
ncbi:MAG: hypothetical protein QOD75_3044 [Blastocatellia bacterium]|nr:hypothetical protein [Blastocatellia bacterium]